MWRATVYSPQRAYNRMEGDYRTAYPRENGGKNVFTVQDYLDGRAPHVTVAGPPEMRGQKFVTDLPGANGPLPGIPVVFGDTGSAFKNGTRRIDLPYARDMATGDMNRHYASGANIELRPRSSAAPTSYMTQGQSTAANEPLPGRMNLGGPKPEGQTMASGGLDPEFSRRLYAMRLGADLSNQPVGVASAYRSVEDQRRAIDQVSQRVLGRPAGIVEFSRGIPGYAAAPGASKHQQGIAADLMGGVGWARNNADRYGLTFPAGLSRTDPNHVEKNKGFSGNIPINPGDSSLYGEDNPALRGGISYAARPSLAAVGHPTPNNPNPVVASSSQSGAPASISMAPPMALGGPPSSSPAPTISARASPAMGTAAAAGRAPQMASASARSQPIIAQQQQQRAPLDQRYSPEAIRWSDMGWSQMPGFVGDPMTARAPRQSMAPKPVQPPSMNLGGPKDDGNDPAGSYTYKNPLEDIFGGNSLNYPPAGPSFAANPFGGADFNSFNWDSGFGGLF